jgi:hypothetical protein
MWKTALRWQKPLKRVPDIFCLLVIAAYAIWSVYELLPLYKQKSWNDLWINVFFGVFSLTIALLLCFNVKIPSPEQPIREFIKSILGK